MHRESPSWQPQLDSVIPFPRDVGFSEKPVKVSCARRRTGARYSGALQKFIHLVNGDLARSALSRSKCAPEVSNLFNRLRERAARERFSDLGVQIFSAHRSFDDKGDLDASPVLLVDPWPRSPKKPRTLDTELLDPVQVENLRAFLKALPELLESNKGEFALVVNGCIVKTDPDEFALLEFGYSQYPDTDGLIQPIQEEPPVIEMGGAAFLAR